MEQESAQELGNMLYAKFNSRYSEFSQDVLLKEINSLSYAAIKNKKRELLTPLDNKVNQYYVAQSINQMNSLGTNDIQNEFENYINFLDVPKNLKIDDLLKYFKKSKNAMKLLTFIEARAMASENGFCVLTCELYKELTGMSRQTYYNHMLKLEELGLISQMYTRSAQGGKYSTLKIIRANRVFIKEFSCGFKSRCNHHIYAKYLDPRFLSIGNRYSTYWKTASKKKVIEKKSIPPELEWAYDERLPDCTLQYSKYRADIKKKGAKKDMAIKVLGIFPYYDQCQDRPSMYEIMYRKAPFWSVELQGVARTYIRVQRARHKIPFYNLSITLPKSFDWEKTLKHSQAIKKIPNNWTKLIMAEIEQGKVQ